MPQSLQTWSACLRLGVRAVSSCMHRGNISIPQNRATVMSGPLRPEPCQPRTTIPVESGSTLGRRSCTNRSWSVHDHALQRTNIGSWERNKEGLLMHPPSLFFHLGTDQFVAWLVTSYLNLTNTIQHLITPATDTCILAVRS